MTNTLRSLCIVALAAASFASQLQPSIAADFYIDGVNDYFSGRACAAENRLSQAMDADAQDPRVYYFRALSLLRQGRVAEARGDMMVGAAIEAKQPRRFAIGSALERVQGPDRLLLEKYRREARQSSVTQASATTPANSPTRNPNPPVTNRTFRERDADVLRQERYVPLEELLRPGAPRMVEAAPIETRPTSAPLTPPQSAAAPPVVSAPAEEPAAEQPSTAPAAGEANPFGDDPAGSAAEPAAPPTLTPATPPQTETPAESTPPATPPADSGDNPFGG
jgi:hypothetical protein